MHLAETNRIPEETSVSRHQSLTTAMAVLLFASPLAAQNVSQDASVQRVAPVTVPAPAALPSLAAERALSVWQAPASATFSLNTTATTAAPVLSRPYGPTSRNTALMVVGGAALLVGAVVGGNSGTIIMVGGGVVGLYGLWNYLQ
jgi:hypothetical protein